MDTEWESVVTHEVQLSNFPWKDKIIMGVRSCKVKLHDGKLYEMYYGQLVLKFFRANEIPILHTELFHTLDEAKEETKKMVMEYFYGIEDKINYKKE